MNISNGIIIFCFQHHKNLKRFFRDAENVNINVVSYGIAWNIMGIVIAERCCMRIHWIKLQNVKCFIDKTIKLEKPDTKEPLSVCALVGVNGSGKSAILKAVVALFTKYNDNYGGESLTDEDIRINSDAAEVAVEIGLSPEESKELGTTENVFILRYKYSGHEGLGEKYPKKDTNYNAGYCVDGLFIETNSSSMNHGAVIQAYRKGMMPGIWNKAQAGLIMYYDPFRFMSRQTPIGPNLQKKENAKINALSSNITINGQNTFKDVDIKQWVINMDYLRLKEPSERNIAIYDHVVKAFDLLLSPLKFESVDKEGCLIFLDEQNGNKETVDMLSDGFKSIFSIVLDIIRRLALAPDYDGQEFYEKEAVILIDEIDCHIHPKWQKKLMPAFRELFPGCQFIVTTHSPYILDTLQEYEVCKIGDKKII